MIEPFVGRDRELAQLAGARDALLRSRGHVVVVSGEAGIGKSRFCTEVADRSREAGARAVVVRCWLDDGAPPLWPWQSIVAELCGDDAVKLLAGGEEVADVGRDRFARFAAVTDRLAEACARTPVCLVIDDIHGADAGALLLTRFVARSLPRFPLLLVLGRRRGEPAPAEDGERARLLHELERDATVITLGGFDEAETEAFLRAHGVATLGPDLIATLSGLTGGHPLFLRRVAQTMCNSGAEPALQGGLRVAIEQAIGGLDPAALRVLSVAAVLGPDPLVGETAEVAGCDTVSVLDAVEDGAAAGLVTKAGDGRLAFGHDLIRAALEDRLPTADRLDAHARAAAVVAAPGGPRAHRLARAAHHARCAATRSQDDARRAVSLCEAAAQAMVRNYAYEQADTLFSAAMELHTSARLGQPGSLLALQWAQVASYRGHLRTARQRYGVAVTRAEAEDRPALLAEAVLGWGGVWLRDYETPVERTRMLGLYRMALDRLPPDDPRFDTLRARLRVRLTAEDAFEGGPVAPLPEAVDAARRTGDPRTVAEALTLAHHALFTPDHTRSRLPLADELIEVTATADLGVLSLMGLLWRTVDILHLGAEPCTRALETLRERAAALGNDHILYHVALIDALLLMGEGRLGDAEAQALRTHELGERIGQPNRSVYLAAQLGSIRWMQGREAEMLPVAEQAATSPALAEREFSVWAMAACLAARAGEHERARVVLDRCLPARLADLAPSGVWLAGVVALVEAAAALEDQELAGQAYDLLVPHADLPAVAGLGVVCLGSTERALGQAAAARGRHDLAVEHLERGVAANERLGNRPMATIARAELAAALVRRDRAETNDRERAGHLLRRAVAEGTAMELTGRAAAWADQLDRLEPRRAAPTARSAAARAPAPSPAEGVIRRDGRRWVVGLGERRVRVPDRIGMRYLAELLTHPGTPIPAAALAGGLAEPGQPNRHELLDRQARSAYMARARELAADLAEAEADNDLHRAERLRLELDALVAQLEAATGLDGRPRAFADDHERARVAVQKAIKRAVDTIDDADPALADVLRRSISTGVTCTYTPDATAPINWSTRNVE